MNKIKYILPGLFLLIIAIIATLVAETDRNEPDLIFSHKFHLEEAGAECSSCHASAETSKSGTDDLLPKEEACMQCHDKKTMECTACHKSGDKPQLIQRITNYSANFNHSKHIEKGYKCDDCHSGIEKSISAADNHLPKMNNCMSCHETPSDVSGCYQCHGKNEDLKPADHSELWMSNHGSFSESGGNKCETCHTQSFCSDCHSGENVFGKPHPSDFLMTHSISFMTKESDCASCHNSYESCVDCHMKIEHVQPADHLINWNKLHKDQAKTKIDVCIVCHTSDDPRCYCHDK